MSNDILKSAEIAWNNYFTNHLWHWWENILCKSIEDVIEDFRQNNFDFPKDIDLVTGGFLAKISLAGKRMGFESSKSLITQIVLIKNVIGDNFTCQWRMLLK